MSDLDITQISNTRYRTSGKADDCTARLQQKLALNTRAQVARLAIGRSLGMGELSAGELDSQGKDIQAATLFAPKPEVIGAWVGVLVSHGLIYGNPVDSLEALRLAIRNHWHRGALALWDDWLASGENYDAFVQGLVRRSNMPPFDGPTTDDPVSPNPPSEPLQDDSSVIVKALASLGIAAQVKDPVQGPRMTRYRVILTNSADLKKLNGSMAELALNLGLGDTLPLLMLGDQPMTTFLDVPRAQPTWKTVEFERLSKWRAATPRDPGKLVLYIGVDVTGQQDVTFDLALTPHLLVAGATGMGKSICLHSILLSLVLGHGPKTLQLALIDPKKVELTSYSTLPHIYGGAIAKDTSAAREMLSVLCEEMEKRNAIFAELGAANISNARSKGEALPFIVCVIDELAGLLSQDENIESLIVRLAQMGRSAGIHLVLATQRPDAATVSGQIRDNVPGRIALAVQKSAGSRIILDENGAENLLGKGDMLVKLPGASLRRVHGVFVRSENIKQIVGAAATQMRQYNDSYIWLDGAV